MGKECYNNQSETNKGMGDNMKKLIRGLMILVFVSLFLICFPESAFAKEELLITDWVIDTDIMENGDLQISEDITFEFNESFNGVYRDLLMDNTSGVTGVRVFMVDGDKLSEYEQVSEAKNGDEGLYTIEEKNNKLLIKIYSPSRDEIKTFRISYTVKNVAVRYKDTAEVYYKFLGEDNETFIKRFIVNIHLPKKDNTDRVRFYGYGLSSGRTDIIDKQIYRLSAKDISSDTFIEGRLLFPGELIPESGNYRDIDRYQEIIDEEAARQLKIHQDEIKREKIKTNLKNYGLVTSGICLLIFFTVLYRCRRRVNRDILHTEFREFPQDCTPAVAAYISGMFASSNVIFATILDLYRKGYLRISAADKNRDISKNKNFIIYKTRDEDISLSGHENYFMRWLFEVMGDGEQVSTKRIKHYREHNWQKFYEAQSIWKKKVKKEADRLGYLDQSKKGQGGLLIVISLVSIILGITNALFGSIYALISFAVGTVLLVYGISLLGRLSDKGYIEYKKWMSFKKYMRENKAYLSGADALDTMDPSLIYALSLCISKVPGQALEWDEAFSNTSWVFWYIVFSSGPDNSFSRSITNSFTGSGGSSSGGSFSSGGGGGAGGGGAGGF